MKLSKTNAINTARAYAGGLIGSGTSWCFYVPYYGIKHLTGPTTEIRADGYHKARLRRRDWIASTALKMMGIAEMDAEYAVYKAHSTDSAIDIVNACIKSID